MVKKLNFGWPLRLVLPYSQFCYQSLHITHLYHHDTKLMTTMSSKKRAAEDEVTPSKALDRGQETARAANGEDEMGEFEDRWEDEIEEEVVDGDAMEEENDGEFLRVEGSKAELVAGRWPLGELARAQGSKCPYCGITDGCHEWVHR